MRIIDTLGAELDGDGEIEMIESGFSPEKSPLETKKAELVKESTLERQNEDALHMSSANKRRKLDDKKRRMVKLYHVSI